MSASRAHERRRVSVVFVDLVASTRLARSLKSDEYFDLMGEILTVLAGEIEALEGQVLQFQGDAVLAAFGAQRAHEDDALRALRAANAAIRAVERYGERNGLELKARAGVDTDTATTGWIGGEYTIFGNVVNLARRLCSAADHGEVLVSERTRLDTWKLVEYEHITNLEVRDYADEAGPYRFSGVREFSETKPELPFIGRRAELGALEGYFTQACLTLKPVSVEVIGGFGTGKSRLLSEFAREIERRPGDTWSLTLQPNMGLNKITQALLPFEATLSLEALFDHLQTMQAEHLTPGLALTLGMRVTGFGQRPWDAVAGLISTLAKRRPLCLVLEQSHGLEPDVRAMITKLEAEDAPILIASHTSRASKPTASVIRVKPFTAAQAVTFLEKIAGTLSVGVAKRVFEASRGNPYLLELLGHALRHGSKHEAHLPESVRRALVARLDRLSLEAREVLTVGAMMSSSFFTGAVEAVLGRSVHNAIEHLLNDGWIEEVPSRWDDQREFEISLPLVRDLAASLSAPRAWQSAHFALTRWFLNRDSVRAAEHSRLSGEEHQFTVALSKATGAKPKTLSDSRSAAEVRSVVVPLR
jgi:class 3 adenylate cyclase